MAEEKHFELKVDPAERMGKKSASYNVLPKVDTRWTEPPKQKPKQKNRQSIDTNGSQLPLITTRSSETGTKDDSGGAEPRMSSVMETALEVSLKRKVQKV